MMHLCQLAYPESLNDLSWVSHHTENGEAQGWKFERFEVCHTPSTEPHGYRFEKDGKSVVYSTDSEHKFESIDESYGFVEFFRGADLLIFDAMYSLADAISLKEDWGHSSNIIGVELAHRAKVKQLALFHHDPNSDDATISRILAETIRFEELSEEGDSLKVCAAYDGQEINL